MFFERTDRSRESCLFEIIFAYVAEGVEMVCSNEITQDKEGQQ